MINDLHINIDGRKLKCPNKDKFVSNNNVNNSRFHEESFGKTSRRIYTQYYYDNRTKIFFTTD